MNKAINKILHFFLFILNAEFNAIHVFQVVSYPSDPCAFVDPMARIILHSSFMDIWHYTTTNNNVLVDPYQYNYNQKDGNIHQFDEIFPLKRCKLKMIEMRCPRDSVKYLEKAYGNGSITNPSRKCTNSKWIEVRNIYISHNQY